MIILSWVVGTAILTGVMLACIAIGRVTDGDNYKRGPIDDFWIGFIVFVFLAIFWAFSFLISYVVLSGLGLLG